MRIRFIYFKDSGKFYSEDVKEAPANLLWHEIVDWARKLQNDRELPGLVKGARFITMINADPDTQVETFVHPTIGEVKVSGYPCLLL